MAEATTRGWKLPDDWREFIDLLNAHEVRYLIVGAHALAVAGRPRATQDIDFWVEPTRENATRLCAALGAFGFRELAGEVERFSRPNQMVVLGRPPFRIDVMTSVSGLTFDDAWSSRVSIAFADGEVHVLGRESLLRNKRASGRAKDMADVAMLLEGAEEE